jgi:DNA-binding FadR family transcriptional regulator
MLRGALPYSRTKLRGVKNSSRSIFEQHLKIVRAIQARDEETAKAAILEHINWMETTLKRVLG